MVLRSVLVPVVPKGHNRRRLDAALKLCRRVQAHLRVVYVASNPEDIYKGLPEAAFAAGVTPDQLHLEAKKDRANAKQEFDTFCADNGVSTDDYDGRLDTTFAMWVEKTGDLESIIATAGRVSDLTVVDHPPANDAVAGLILDAAVFSTGCPALVMPDRIPDDFLRHVVIAWNGSLEASRTIGHSIALLHEASHVSIVTVPSARSSEASCDELKDYLIWHGIRARQLPDPAHGESVGASLLAAAERADATMLMMGAYTHSRVQQFMLGGVTRHMLHHASIPVLMEH